MNNMYWRSRPIPEPFYDSENGMIFQADAKDFLSNLDSEIADIIFLDPPFNLGKKYGSRTKNEDMQSEKTYFNFIMQILSESIRILKPGGALFFYHIPQWAIRFASLLNENLVFRHWIAISMKNGFARGKKLYPAHYALLYFTKGEPKFFNRPKITPPTCRKCGNYIRDYGGYKKYIENGINLSDIWEDISPVRHSKYKNRISNELPIEILRRVVEIAGAKDSLLIDPFVGSGTSIVAALEKEMNFIAIDREIEYCRIAAERLNNKSIDLVL